MTMILKPLKTKADHEAAVAWVDGQFDKAVTPESPAGEKLQVMLLLIKQYEDEHYPVLPPAPLEAIRLKMEERGLKNQDLVGKIGSKGYVSDLLSGKKPLTLSLAKLFHRELGIPAEILLG
jgi:HTH-type transcriptional regulator/antitoxin HigA